MERTRRQSSLTGLVNVIDVSRLLRGLKTYLTLVVSYGLINVLDVSRLIRGLKTYLTLLVVSYGAYKCTLIRAYYSPNHEGVVASGLRATTATNEGGSGRRTGPRST